MADPFQRWCDATTSYVRYFPDRAGIEKELRDHFEDHRDALLDCGYDRELAEERALEAMGDPHEVGKGLNQVHSPVWGWLWSLSKLCLYCAVLLCLVVLLGHSHDREDSLVFRCRNQFPREYEEGASAVAEIPGGRARLTPTNFNDQTGWELVLTVDLDSPLGWKPEIENLLTVRDDHGILPSLDPSLDTEPRSPNTGSYVWCANDPSWTHYVYWVSAYREGEPPQWVELSHPDGWSLRIDLDPEVLS